MTFSLSVSAIRRRYTVLIPLAILILGAIVSYLIFIYINKLNEDKTYLHEGFEVTQTHHLILQRLTMIESHLAAVSGLFLSSEKVDPDEWQAFITQVRTPNARQARLMDTMVKGIYYFKSDNAFSETDCHSDFAFNSYTNTQRDLPCKLLHAHMLKQPELLTKSTLLHAHANGNDSEDQIWHLSPILKKNTNNTETIIGWFLLLIDNSILFEPTGEAIDKDMQIDVFLPEESLMHNIYNYGHVHEGPNNEIPYLYLNNPEDSAAPAAASNRSQVIPRQVRLYPQLGSVTYLNKKLMTLEARVFLGDVQFIIKIWRPLGYSATTVLAAFISIIVTIFIASFVWLQLRVRQRAEDLAEKMTQELSLNEGRLRAAIEGSNDGLWDIDFINNSVWLSPRWYGMLGYEDQEFPYSYDTFDQLLHPDDRATANNIIREHFASGAPYDIQFRMRHKSGEYLWIRSRGFLKTTDGKVVRASGIHSDVTKERLYASTLEQARNTAEAASQAKAEFVANMSHEIRTPLNGIVGVIELLQNTQLTPKQQQYVDILDSSSVALFDIVNEVLDFSKIEAGQMKIERVGFNLVQTASDAIEVAQQYARQKPDVEVILRISPDLPQRFVSDPTRIRQCMLNLMSNAIKFTHKGFVLLDIDGQKNSANEYDIVMKVQDTGIGIPTDKLDSIFQQFTQADTSTTREYGGTGLGLTIVKTIVEMLGGTIDVTSSVGGGSCFTIRVSMPLDGEEQPNLDLHDMSSLSGKTVLVVDDNTTNLTIFEEILLHAGMQVTSTSGPVSALEHFALAANNAREFDFALIDFNMPHMTGKQLVETIRNRCPNLKTHFILASSAMQRNDNTRMRELKFRGYLQKPITGSVLLSMLLAVQKLADQGAKNIFVTRHTINEAARTHQSNATAEEVKKLPKLRILMVEDNLTNQQVLSWILGDAGYEHKIASNGQEALDILATDTAFDLILMDCQMPIMDGFAATKEIRKLPGNIADVPIFALTANASRDDERRALQAGMNSFLTKPVNLKKLYRAFESLNSNVPITHEQFEPIHESDGVLEEKRLLEITGNSPERLQRFLTLFTETFDSELQHIQGSFASGDMPALARHVHTLKGAAANLHALHIRDCALALETSVKAGNIDEIRRKIEALEATYGPFKAAYKAVMQKVAP